MMTTADLSIREQKQYFIRESEYGDVCRLSRKDEWDGMRAEGDVLGNILFYLFYTI